MVLYSKILLQMKLINWDFSKFLSILMYLFFSEIVTRSNYSSVKYILKGKAPCLQNICIISAGLVAGSLRSLTFVYKSPWMIILIIFFTAIAFYSSILFVYPYSIMNYVYFWFAMYIKNGLHFFTKYFCIMVISVLNFLFSNLLNI